MTSAKALLEQATPRPWMSPRLPGHVSGCRTIKGHRYPGAHRQAQYRTEIAFTTGLSDDAQDKANAALIVYAVNRLPDYEAAVDALEEIESRLEKVWDLMEPRIWTEDPKLRALGGPVEALCQDTYFALETTHAALARLRGES